MHKESGIVEKKTVSNTEGISANQKHSSFMSPSHYVGIGASAGGLEAIERFITNMVPENNLAFIIIQHLSPDYKSLMVELLAKKTTMPVHRAEDGMEVLAGNVYLIPPKKNLTIFHGKLLLKEKNPGDGINLPIDIFLQSLAHDQSERAIAVILSGTGSDGARGVRAIKEQGGMVMVQEESSAKFDGMPRAAISTGAADYILTPEEMPDQLLSYVAHPYISGEKPVDSLLEDGSSLTRLFAELRAKTKVDFTHYKPTTISRRIERRMTVNQITDFDEYVRYLSNFPGEVMALYRELLIGVTSFFRDEEAMQEIRTRIVPRLLEYSSNREIRCWVAGCSTGEEAYTLAIMFKELMEEQKVNRDIKIFATDIDREAIIRASSGIYPESIAADLPRELLNKYFYHKEDAFQITRTIREMVVFAQHNLVNDPPFTNIDLISCRNLLIYLQPILQSRALSMFNFSLTPGGILFLGNSETIGDMTDYFQPLHQRHRIYESRGRSYPIAENLQMREKNSNRSREAGFYPRRRTTSRTEGQTEMIKAFLELATEKYLPLAVIVDDQLEIRQVIGDTTGYFSIPSGPVEYNISKLAARDLAIPLATGIQKVFRTGEKLTYSNIRLERTPHNVSIRLFIHPLSYRGKQEDLAVVFFERYEKDEKQAENGEIYNADKEAAQRIEDLEQELQFARENLQATIEELETSNEELQATNEELLASNEELQSTNEELQSTNEELYTVNAEHQNKIIELTELNNDVDNLLTSSKIGTLIIDENLEIRKYSPEITNIFNILDKDIGRPFSHISHQLVTFDPVESVKNVQQSEKLLEEEVQTRDGKTYLARIVPYHIGPRVYSGIVLTFVDISELHSTRETLQRSREEVHHIRQNIPAGLLIFQLNKGDEPHLLQVNPEAEKLTGISISQHENALLSDLWPQAVATPQLRECFDTAETGRICVIDDVRFTANDRNTVFHIHAFNLPENRLAISFEETLSPAHTTSLTNIDRKGVQFLLNSSIPLWWEWNLDDDSIKLSTQFEKRIGLNRNAFESGKDFWVQVIHPDDYENVVGNRKQWLREKSDIQQIRYRLRNGKDYTMVIEQGAVIARDCNIQPIILTAIMEAAEE